MSLLHVMPEVLSRNLEMLKMHLADFSDQDMLVRPVPGANHVAWQLGHLANSEHNMVNAVSPGATPPLPAGFAEKFNKETAKLDDAKAFPSKAEILDTLTKVRTASIAWVKTLSEADLQRPTPERLQRLAATVEQMLILMPSHIAMHIGQIQVLRRKLGRPVMF